MSSHLTGIIHIPEKEPLSLLNGFTQEENSGQQLEE